MSLFDELGRRNVFRVGVIGLPFAIGFSRVYELTPDGIGRGSEVDRSASITHVAGRRLGCMVIALPLLTAALLAYDRFVPADGQSSPALLVDDAGVQILLRHVLGD